MSLDPVVTNIAMFAGHDQADVAALEANGIFYRCFVWLNRSTWAIEACCYRAQPGGGEVVVFHNIVARASAQEVTDSEGIPLDSPKIIAVGTTFVVHWLQATDTIDIPPVTRNFMLYRATMDMESFSTTSWDNRGAVALLETHLLYDVCPLIGNDREFVVARLTDEPVITVQRFSGFDWIDVEWTESVEDIGSPEVAPRVLAVYAHEADNDVIVTFERDDGNGRLWSAHVDADTAGGQVFAQTMTEFSAAAGENGASWVQVGHCRVAANEVAVVAEARASSNASGGSTLNGLTWIHHLVYRTINSSTCAHVSNIHWAAHLHMCSRPWAYAGGTGLVSPTPDVYVLTSYRSLVDAYDDGAGTLSGGSTWSQAYHFALNLDFRLWNTVADGGDLRPRVIATMYTLGVPDARSSGWHPETGDVHVGGPTKRMNHVSYASAAPSEGPDVKTRTVAGILWARLAAASDNDVRALAPEHADASALVVYMEDAMTVFRDETDPAQPRDNFFGANPRPMCQSLEMGRALICGGGTPYSYDGQQVVELGFLTVPEIIDFVVASSSGSETDELDAGVHQVMVVKTWRDNAGQLHRSGHSNIIQVSAAALDVCLLAIRTDSLSLKDASAHFALASQINFEVYATLADGVLFYRVFGSDQLEGGGATQSYRPRDTPANSPAAISGRVLVYFGLPDARLELQGLGPYQYDAGGALIAGPVPITPPAMSVIASFQGRMVGADLLDRRVFWYADELLPEPGGEFSTAPEFNANGFFSIPEKTDETTGMQEMDGVLFAFTPRQIYAITAQDAGSGLLSMQARLAQASIGCIDPRSIVLYPHGIGFQSAHGYATLMRSGEIAYGALSRSRDEPQSTGGAAVEDDVRLAGNIRSAVHMENESEIRLVANGRPRAVQTWTMTVSLNAGLSAGTWTIDGLDEPVEVIAGPLLAASAVADLLAARVADLMLEPAPDTLRFQVASVSSPGATVVIELFADEEASLTGTAPGIGSVDGVLATTLTTVPQVLIHNYELGVWTKRRLVQTNTSTRLSELVGGCVWHGSQSGEALHVALAQGGPLVERASNDDDLYADQTSTGLVGIPIDLTWSWWHLAGLAGFKRIRRFAIQLERFTPADIFVDVEYDRDGSLTGQRITPSTYSWSDEARGYIEVRPREQKVAAMRVRLYEAVGVTTERTCSVAAVAIEVGQKKGMKRVGDGQIGAA